VWQKPVVAVDRHAQIIAPLASEISALPLIAVLLLCLPAAPSRADVPLPGGRERGKVENFLLLDHEGKSRELYHQTGARAVVLIFTTTGCSIVEKSIPTIKALRDEFASKGIIFWLVDSNTEDDAKTVSEETRSFAIDLPVLLDHNQSVARSLGATRTAEAFCIEPKKASAVRVEPRKPSASNQSPGRCFIAAPLMIDSATAPRSNTPTMLIWKTR